MKVGHVCHIATICSILQIGSSECTSLLQPSSLTNGFIDINSGGTVIEEFFGHLPECVNRSTFYRGGAVFFITNVPCTSMCAQSAENIVYDSFQLYTVIEKQQEITDKLNGIGYVFRIIYFDDLGDLQYNPESYRHPNEYVGATVPFAIRKNFADVTMRDEWEIAEGKLFVNESEILGRGAFAVCYRGTLKGILPVNRVFKNLNLAIDSTRNPSNEVAVKMLPEYADEATRADFLKEISFMKNLGYHAHIVSLVGCVSNRVIQDDDITAENGGFHLHTKDLISIAWQICDGMVSCKHMLENMQHD
ncbi:unnamed protein product [Toxocara canis]|uniref:Protein kinase domain-containing protein n=1 Tax=Toxocara canis TaxID=6265 RepID=A0A183TZY1_TOXCA|nr:unnamed protein product [Toxocara canis]